MALNGWVQKMRGKKEKKERGKEEKEKGKGRKKWGSKAFFISPRVGFFICTVVTFWFQKVNCI